MTFTIDHAFKTGLIKIYKSENKMACECSSLSTPVEFSAKRSKRRGEKRDGCIKFSKFWFYNDVLMNL